MADALIAISQSGPLPITQVVNIQNDGPSLIMLSASAWSQTANTMIGVELVIDGAVVTSAMLFCNPTDQHMSLVSTPVPYTFSFGQHTITLQAATSTTVSDSNDFYGVTLLY
ncbi:hypothetical protein [Caenimonas koreensis]|uniref:Uncharacterized protein n=1 Tax=Caenimonas koreensis DSM 17982 TaxID=1121255 RepID=A0A844AYV7_9BURK|nr:hypothetical protein [Caenimonas koreensis]MRD49740.1 hypothetical protein [Caenimonas koreensis DSM 17982]